MKIEVLLLDHVNHVDFGSMSGVLPRWYSLLNETTTVATHWHTGVYVEGFVEVKIFLDLFKLLFFLRCKSAPLWENHLLFPSISSKSKYQCYSLTCIPGWIFNRMEYSHRIYSCQPLNKNSWYLVYEDPAVDREHGQYPVGGFFS